MTAPDPMGKARRNRFFPPGFCYAPCEDDPISWVYQVEPQFEGQATSEAVIYTFTHPPFRLHFPVPTTATQLQAEVARAVAVHSVCLCWPPYAPHLPGNVMQLVAWPHDLDHLAAVGIVDARRVHPIDESPIWLTVLPDRANHGTLFGAIEGHQVCITPSGIDNAVDIHHGVRVLTLLADSPTGGCCVGINPDFCSRFPGTRTFGQTPQVDVTTSTTTFGPTPEQRVAASIGLHDVAGLPVTFYATSGMCRPRVLQAGQSAKCVDILAALSYEFYAAGVSPSIAFWRASDRAYRLSNGRLAIFVLSGHGDHEPAQAAVWIDIGHLWPHPYPLHVPSFASWPQARKRVHASLPEGHTVTVNGLIWRGETRFFANWGCHPDSTVRCRSHVPPPASLC